MCVLCLNFLIIWFLKLTFSVAVSPETVDDHPGICLLAVYVTAKCSGSQPLMSYSKSYEASP